MKKIGITLIIVVFGMLAKAQDTEQIINLADSLSVAGNHEEAITLLEKNITLFENDSVRANVFDKIGDFYAELVDYAQAQKNYLEAKDIRETTLGKDHFDYATSANNLGWIYSLTGDYEKTEKYFLEAKDIIEKVLGKEHPEYATALNNLGWIYSELGDYAKTESFYLEAIVIIDKMLGKEHPSYTNSLNNLGSLYVSLGDYAQAEKFLLEAKEIREKTLGKENRDFANSLNNLGSLYRESGDYVQAEKYFIEAKNIRETILGKEHPDYAHSLRSLGLLYSDLVNYEQAEKYYLEALNIQEKIFGKEHPSNAVVANNLGSIYYGMGDYAQAEKYYLEVIAFFEKAYGKEHPNYATMLNNLGLIYSDLGNFAQAEKYYLETTSIREKIFGKDHPDYAISLNSLGALYAKQGDFTKGEKYYIEAHRIFEKTLGNEHPTYASSLNSLGALYSDMGDFTQAEKYYIEAKNIREKVLGKDHPDLAASLNNLGALYNKSGDYMKAEDYYIEANNIWKKKFGEKNPTYAISLYNILGLYLNKKEFEKATILNKEIHVLLSNIINENFAFLSERQRNQYWKTQEGNFWGSYALSWFHPASSANEINYNNTLFIKGLLLRTTNSIRDAIYDSGNEELISQYEQLGVIRQEIGNLQQKTDYDNEQVLSLQERADSLDKAVTQASQAYRNLKTDLFMTWQDVQKQLEPNEAAIEFVHFRLYDKKWTDSILYVAMVLRPDMEAPVWIPLCEQKQLEGLLQPTTQYAQLQANNLYIDKGEKLYQLIWQAIEKELPNVKTIYYSPSGLLNKIAFNAIPTVKEDVLISDKYDVQLVSSTREIARLKKEKAADFVQDTTVVYGGLTYDLQQSRMLAAARRYQSNNQESINEERYMDRRRRLRDLELPDAELRSGFPAWGYLEGTKTETEQIVSSLEDKHIPHLYYTDDQGNEESFKQLSGTKTEVIHLATHGFFLPDIEDKVVENLAQRLGGGKKEPFENPLLRSGLIMSGANNQWIAAEYMLEEDMEDGILTADEIAHLNLTKTKLVVLSACETGLGDVKNSEGVFGLQRAFKLAGVESLIISLWKVPDEATSELMTTFYQQWLSGRTKQNAFKAAQKKVREKFETPFYWAAFVMMD